MVDLQPIPLMYARYRQPLAPEEIKDVLDETERIAEIMERIPDPVWRVIERLLSR